MALAAAAVIAVAVITDLPTNQTRSSNIAGAKSIIQSVNYDMGGCTFAVSEAYRLTRDALGSSISAADRAKIPGLMNDDQSACSLTSQYILDLSGIETPGTAAGRDLGDAVSVATTWVTSDALGEIVSLQKIVADHASKSARRELAYWSRFAATDKAKVDADVAAAGKSLGDAKLPAISLPTLSASV